MAAIHSDAFKRDAVRIALCSGLTQLQVASDLEIGLSTLGKCVWAASEEAKVPAQDADLSRARTSGCAKRTHIDPRRTALFMARSILRGYLDGGAAC